jgi:putative membrane protein
MSTLAAAISLTWGCAGDPKPAESPDGEVMKTVPPTAEDSAPAPNGEPTGMPPSEPSSQSSPQGGPANALAAPAASVAPLTEGQIARIADVANTAEIEQGKLAQTKAKNPRVRAFAAKMVKHHGQAKTEQARLLRELSITSAESATASALESDGEKALLSLKSASSGDFDAAYLDGQVTAHEKVLSTLDEQLLPSARSESVVSALRVARSAVAAHLDEAKAIRGELATPTH